MFSDDEIDAAVQRYLLDSVNMPTTRLGSRDIVAAKQQIYELVSTAFMLRPASLYYVLWLSSNRLSALLGDQAAAIATLRELAAGTSGSSKRVESTTELSNAEAALLDLNTAANARTTGVSTSVGPAVLRFSRSVERFIATELTKNVVRDGDVVDTPEGQRESVRQLWWEIAERQAEIDTHVAALQGASSDYSATRLPDSTLRGVTSRIQIRLQELQEAMAATTAPRDSRAALLDLFAMRLLLRRAASFRSPTSNLAPLTGDPTTGTLGTGAGSEFPAIAGTVNGPWNYAAGTQLSLSLDGGTSLPVITLPGTSAAVLRSATMSPYVAPPSTNAATVLANGVTNTVAMSASWTTGSLAAAGLDAAFAGITVTWDAAASQLVFTSNSTADGSKLEATASPDFLAWAFLGAPRVALGEAQDVVAAIAAASPSIDVSAPEAQLAVFSGATAGGGVVSSAIRTASDATTDGTTRVSMAANLELLGVEPGMIIRFTTLNLTRTIVAVDGPDLVLSATVTAAVNTPYYIALDLSAVPVNARVRLTSAANAGLYRVTATGPGTLTLTPAPSSGDTVQARVFTKLLRLASRGVTSSTGIAALASAGAAAVGLTVVAEKRASLDTLNFASGDFLLRDIAVGDLLSLQAPSTAVHNVEITEVQTRALRFTPALAYESGNWIYSVRSADAVAFETLRQACADFVEDMPATSDLELVVRRLYTGARYTAQLSTVLEAASSSLSALKAQCDTYAVERDASVDSAVRVMQEHGFDRALDLFLSPAFVEFFSMPDDGVSYKTWLIRRLADTTRQTAPVQAGAGNAASFRVLSDAVDSPYDPRAARDKEF